ncbi:hypothetical protein SSE37_22984 [Sagittula stellata E-37]|uniref:Uncharacterized protein n=1 Tax=Sagittula stellata (strain ATCC 700073 / DSM 11524 / E-37) TaxID=388399 RepID=A3K042_SAGS3|nr:hypothetical protein SSE37_22984 [Sagittula stellata E-37]
MRVPDAQHNPLWWHPVKALAIRPTLRQHGLAILATLATTLGAGISVVTLAFMVEAVSTSAAGAMILVGYVLIFSVAFTWIGHLAGAFVLHAALIRGLGGWGLAMLGGFFIGAVLRPVVGTGLTVGLGPFLAVLQLALLRAIVGRNTQALPRRGTSA